MHQNRDLYWLIERHYNSAACKFILRSPHMALPNKMIWAYLDPSINDHIQPYFSFSQAVLAWKSEDSASHCCLFCGKYLCASANVKANLRRPEIHHSLWRPIQMTKNRVFTFRRWFRLKPDKNLRQVTLDRFFKWSRQKIKCKNVGKNTAACD